MARRVNTVSEAEAIVDELTQDLPPQVLATRLDPREVLARPFPPEAIKKRAGGGGKSYDYVDHATVTRRLIEATDNNFDWQVTHVEYRDDRAPRAGGGQAPTVMIVTGTLTIPGLGSRAGTGVQVIQPGGGEDQYKGAESDAIKRAAMRFGVAIGLYGEDIEGVLAAADAPATGDASLVPTDPEERKALCRSEKDRVGLTKIKTWTNRNLGKDRLADLTYEEQGLFLQWSLGQRA